MKQALTLRWKSSSHYQLAVLTPDLFGGWVLVTASGKRDHGGGRLHQKPLASYEQGVEAIQALRHRRRREGYDYCGASFMALSGLDARNPEVRSAESDALARLFAAWALNEAEQAGLLGLDVRMLSRVKDGQALPDEPTLLARTTHLLAINKALRLRFAGDVDAVRAWLRLPCRALRDQAPLDVMLESLETLARLRHHLGRESDRARGCAGVAQSPAETH